MYGLSGKIRCRSSWCGDGKASGCDEKSLRAVFSERDSGRKATECAVAFERASEEPGRIVVRTKTVTEGGRGAMIGISRERGCEPSGSVGRWI